MWFILVYSLYKIIIKNKIYFHNAHKTNSERETERESEKEIEREREKKRQKAKEKMEKIE